MLVRLTKDMKEQLKTPILWEKKTKTQSTTQNTTLVGNRNKNGSSDKGIRKDKLGNAQRKSEGYTGGEITGDIW